MRENASEMAHFAQLAKTWWDPLGSQRILHKMNVMRMDFIRETIAQAGAPGYAADLLPPSMRRTPNMPSNLSCLDIGCGGGLLTESLARVPFTKSVLGVDVTPEVLAVAEDHQRLDPQLKNLEYRLQLAETLDPAHKFDLVTMFEVLEHLDEPARGLDTALGLVKPGGWLFLSTINRTVAAYLSTIFLGEHVLGIVPVGTHTWSKYINETEVRDYVAKRHPGFQAARLQGCVYVPTQGWLRFDPSSRDWHLKALDCLIGQDGGNYLLALRRNA